MNLKLISMIKLIKKLDKKSSLYSYKYLYYTVRFLRNDKFACLEFH